MKVLILLFSVVLVGCSAPDALDKRQQDYACSASGGVFKYARAGGGSFTPRVRCNSAEYKKWYNIVIPNNFLKGG